MRAFISHSYSHRKTLKHTIETISKIVHKFEIQSFVFTQEYQFDPSEYQVMMKKACNEIVSSDMLIAEISHKAVGVGVEVGFAKGIGKKVICLRSKDSPISTTLMGMADINIEYDNLIELGDKLSRSIKKMRI